MRWTPDMDALLREVYPVEGQRAAAELLGVTPAAAGCRAGKLGARTRRRWTPEEEARVRSDYHCVPLARLAAALGRTSAATALKAALLGVADRYGKRPAWTPELEARYRELHAAGLTDTEIAPLLGTDRPWLNAHRRRLGLPSNRNHERFRGRMQAHMRAQIERAGVATFAEFRHNHTRALCRSHGLPEDLAPRELQIVLALTGGPRTKSQICAAIGLTWRPGRAAQKTLHSGRSGGTYLGDLTRRGLVVRVRLPGSGGKGPSVAGVEQNVYLLTALAMDLLAKGGPNAAAAP